jgi:hypothetical protein
MADVALDTMLLQTSHSSMLTRLLAGARKISSGGAVDESQYVRRLNTPPTESQPTESEAEVAADSSPGLFAYFIGLQAALLVGNWAWKRYRRSQRKAGSVGRKRSHSGGSLRMY